MPSARVNCIMRMVRWLSLGAILSLPLLSGCARGKTAPAASPPNPAYHGTAARNPGPNSNVIITPDESLDGKIAWVNSNLGFVVITFPIGQMPETDRRLGIYRRGLKVGEVKITGPRREDSIVANIVAGNAAVGDEVSDR